MTKGRSTAPPAKALLVLVLALVPGLVLATGEPPAQDLPDRIAAVAALNEQIAQAAEKVTKQDWTAALPLLKTIIEAPAFEYLTVERRHALLTGASGVAVTRENYKLAQAYSVRACALPNPTATDWQMRLYASFYMNDFTDAAISLTQIARQTPKAVAEVNDDLIFRILSEIKKSPAPTAPTFELMAALYGANWKIEGAFEPSSVWRDYALALMERGKVNEAKQVTPRIKQASVLISMRVDKRFDPIVRSSPELFNINKAVETEIDDFREIVRKSPRSLQNVVQLTYALLKDRRYDEVLTLTDEVTQKANDPSGKRAYDDGENLIWILNNRAIALGGLGRRDEELELLIRAARRPEHGEPNISQAINLGEFYCDLGRPKDALFAVVDVQNTSPYGLLQLESVHLCAALQLSDKEAADSALNVIKEHQADSPSTYQTALVDTEDLDSAAALLIRRLDSASLRSDALVEVQNYNDPKDLSWPMKLRGRFSAVKNRDDVQQAINKVGRIETFNLRSDLP